MTIEIVSDRVPQTCGTRTSREFLGELLGQRVGRRVRYLIDVLLHLVPRLRFSFVFAVLQLLDLLDVMPTMRQEQAVVVPTAAMQTSQRGTYVFVIKDGAAVVQPVKVARSLGRDTVIESGLDGGEQVVTDGQLQLTNGSRVEIRQRKAGS